MAYSLTALIATLFRPIPDLGDIQEKKKEIAVEVHEKMRARYLPFSGERDVPEDLTENSLSELVKGLFIPEPRDYIQEKKKEIAVEVHEKMRARYLPSSGERDVPEDLTENDL